MQNNFNLMLITNDIDVAKYAVECKINRIFIDLEILGKFERQGHLDTVISQHSMQDVHLIRKGVPNAELLVRINPLHDGTEKEINEAIEAGADIIMLPMFQSEFDIQIVGQMINGRAKFIPLIETKSAAESILNYVNSTYVSEFYIGLNDLHRELGYQFMFELLSNGYVEALTRIIQDAGKPFGFGGVARIGDGTLPADLILAEHIRLGSSAVILSRAFHKRSESLNELKENLDLNLEIYKLFGVIESLKKRNKQQVIEDKNKLIFIVNKIVDGIK